MLVGIFVVLALLRCFNIVYPKSLEWTMYDVAVRHLVPDDVADERVVIVEVSNQSLRDMQQNWPFSRSQLADFIRALDDAEPAVIALDMIFQTPSSQAHLAAIDQIFDALARRNAPADQALVDVLNEQYEQLDEDLQLSKALAASNRVILGNILLSPDEAPLVSAQHPRLESSMALLEANARGIGVLNANRAWDGVVRRYDYLPRLDDKPLPSLALAAVENAFPERQEEFRDSIEDLDEGRPLLRFPRAGIRRIHYSDVVMRRNVADIREQLRGRIVFVGVTAAGLHDQHATPIANVLPGVELHAFAAMNLLNQTHYQSHGGAAWMGLILTMLVLGGVFWSAEQLSMTWLMSIALGIGLGHLTLMYAMLVMAGWLLAFMPVVVGALVLVLVEIFYRVRALRRQRRAVREQERLNLARSDFMATISHELRTPLTSIRGSLGLLAGGVVGALPAQANELVSIAHSNTERLIRLVNNFLDLQKIASGKMEFHFEILPLADLLRDTVAANEGFGQQFDIQLQLDATTDVSVRADSDLLTQAITNLLSNAIKFSPTGETVQVTAESGETQVRIAVIDHGPGIPEEFRARIFSRFAQSADVTSTSKGSGLGLNIVKLIVEEHGGTVGFDTEIDHGTTFYIDLPLVEPTDTSSP